MFILARILCYFGLFADHYDVTIFFAVVIYINNLFCYWWNVAQWQSGSLKSYVSGSSILPILKSF